MSFTLLKYKEKFISGMKKRVIENEDVSPEIAEKIADKTWQIIEDSSHYSFNSCISGKTIIQKAGANGHYNPTIEEMFFIMNDQDYAQATGHLDLHRKYHNYGYGNALSLFEDNRIRKNKHQFYTLTPDYLDRLVIYKSSNLKDAYDVLASIHDSNKYNL